MTTIGKLIDIPLERDVEWRIEDFSALSTEVGECYASPLFYFVNASWCLRIHPNGQKSNKSIGYIGVYLYRKCSSPPIRLDYALKLKTMDEMIDRQKHGSHNFEKPNEGWGWSKFLKRSTFLKSRSEPGVSDVLRLICTMKYLESTDDASKTVTALCSYCKKSCEAETISFHEGKCLDKPIKCPECFGVIQVRDWYDHECQKSSSEVFEKMSQDFEAVLLSGEHSDFTISIKGTKFQLHKSILAARNTYFHSMFKTDMKEKNTGFASIEDCDPDTFHILIQFIYTGKIHNMTIGNVCDLYEIVDKYQEDLLKEKCIDFMMKTFCVNNFCDYIVLALKYDEKKLFAKAVEFFISDVKEIVPSAKWQIFMREYPTQANELFLKSINHYVE